MILTYIVLPVFYLTSVLSFSSIGGAPRRRPFCGPNHHQQWQGQGKQLPSVVSAIADAGTTTSNKDFFVRSTCATSRTSSIPNSRHDNRFSVRRRGKGVNVLESHNNQVEASSKDEEPGVVSDLSPMRCFESDVNKVLNRLTIDEDLTIYPQIFATSPLTITRVWDLDLWTRSTSRTRYIRFLGNMFFSRLFKRILPQLVCFIVWSVICVSIITDRVKTVTTHFVPMAALSLISTFIAFLITLRTNQSLNRLGEARNLWGRLFITSRDTAQLLSTYVYEMDKSLGLKGVRYLSLFSWLVKDRLRDTNRMDIIETMLARSSYTNSDGDNVEALIVNSSSSDYASNLESEDLSYLSSQRKRPAAIIARIRQIVAVLAERNMLPYAPHQQLEQNLNEMNYILGMCERLKGSPIPPVYTSHTSRLLVFYLVFLPLALHGSALEKVTTVLVTATVSYTLLGLDEISHVLEQPFRLMPLHELSRNIMMDVADAFVCRPPSLVLGSESGLKVDESENGNEDRDQITTAPMYWP